MEYKDLLGHRVRVYWNLHKKCFSIKMWDKRSPHKGYVVAHTTRFTAVNCKYVVQKAGQQRVRRERKKNVHAYIEGVFVDSVDTVFKFAETTYNPYEDEGFVTRNWIDRSIKHPINVSYICKGVEKQGHPYVTSSLSKRALEKHTVSKGEYNV